MEKKNNRVDYDLNMSVSALTKIPKDLAYWCVPALQKTGPSKGKLQSYIWADQTGFPIPKKYTFVIDYPFDEAYTEEYDPVQKTTRIKNNGEEIVEEYRYDSIGDIVWAAAKAYVNAFKWAKEKDVGYWHGIGDLVFEGMTIYDDGTVEFSVGS